MFYYKNQNYHLLYPQIPTFAKNNKAEKDANVRSGVCKRCTLQRGLRKSGQKFNLGNRATCSGPRISQIDLLVAVDDTAKDMDGTGSYYHPVCNILMLEISMEFYFSKNEHSE